MAENKVNFGLKNVHYSTITVADNGAVTYGPVTPIPGAVELSLEPRGDMSEFYADDILYYSAGTNQGYDGTLTIANIPKQFAIDCLGETEDPQLHVMTEKVTDKGKNFALMFEFDGDKKATRHILYNCSVNRPTLGSSTKTSTTEPFTNELTFVSMAREDYSVKTKTLDTTPVHIYESWFRKVYDGIKITPNNAAPTYSKANATQGLTIRLVSPGAIEVTGVKINGVDQGAAGTQWTYAEATKDVNIKGTALASLNQTQPNNKHSIVIETNIGNDVLVEPTVTA